MGEYKWLTVVSPDEQDGTELLLEPNAFEPAKVFQKALFDAGIPLTMFNVEDIESKVNQLKDKGVLFTMEPTNMGNATIAIFEDTCGNKIQLVQV